MDSAAIQWQIRNNALEAQEMASDLLKWQQQMKQKEAAVAESSGSTAQQEQHAQLPVVRGRAAQAAPAAPAPAPAPVQADATTKQSQQQHPAAHTYKNYSKWDTYDVDAAVAAAEQDEEPQHQQKPKQPAAVRNSSRSIQQKQQQPPPPPMPDSRVPNAPKAPKDNSTPAAKASALKDQGNKLFQARYYDDAIACYSQSIDALPTAVAFANRAMAYLKLERFPIEAEADCSAALLLDATYVKAWHRRGTARKQLGKLLDAACDFEEALRLEPGNVSLQADRDQALQQHLKLQQLGGRNSSSSSWKAIPVKQQQQPEQQQDTPVRSQQQDQKQQQQEEEKGTQPVSVLPPKSSSPKQSPQQQQASEAVRPVTPPPTAISSSKTSSPQALASPQQRQSVAAAAQAAAQQLAARLASNLRPPKTGHEFEAAWRSFKGDVVLQVGVAVVSCECVVLLTQQRQACIWGSRRRAWSRGKSFCIASARANSVIAACLSCLSVPHYPLYPYVCRAST